MTYGAPAPYQTKRNEEQIEFDEMVDGLVQQALHRGQPVARRAILSMMMPTAPPEVIDDQMDQLTFDADTMLAYLQANPLEAIPNRLRQADRVQPQLLRRLSPGKRV